jgi:type VI secretion system protein ImpK
MRSAGSLLLLLGRLRVSLSRASAAQIIDQVAASIQDFDKEVRQVGVPADQAKVAKYLVCATADDIVQNIPGDDRHIWTQHSMLSRFFGERIGGVRFFEELERALADPSTNYYLLELQHACLALGFQGVHRTSAGGAATLQQIQRNLYETLRRVRPKASELSPRWRGQSFEVRVSRAQVPVWAVASVAAVLLLGLYAVLQFLLSSQAEAVANTIAAMPDGRISLYRRVPAPPPPPPPPPPPSTQIQRIRTALGPEIAANKLTVQETPTSIVIRVGNLVLFRAGDATVRDEFRPVAERIAAALDREPGAIRVIGHTDSAPIRTIRFPNNHVLSVERAKAVAELLRTRLAQPDRMSVDGKGPDAPVASNETPEGRAQNRRVEVLIQRNG